MTAPIDEVDIQHRRTLLIAGVMSVAVILIGAGVALAVLANRQPAAKPVLTPAEQTSATPVSSQSTSSVSASSSTSPTLSSATVTSSSPPLPAGQIVHSGRIAYRLGGQVWMAGEDGSGAKAVIASANGAYALSPDGKTIVAAEGTSTFTLVNTSNLMTISVRGATDLPTWSPDSSWLAYTTYSSQTGHYSVRRINRTGLGDSLLIAIGSQPRIAPDGTRVAFTKSPQPAPSDALQVYDTSTKSTRVVPRGEGVSNFAWAAGGALYFTKNAAGTASGWLGMADKALSQTTIIVFLPAGTPHLSPSGLYPSPDGSKVLFALAGEDGNNSRLQIADAAAKRMTAVSTRFDAYPRGWLLDGSAVLYIRGNEAIRGETTSLCRIRPDGSRDSTLVAGAGL